MFEGGVSEEDLETFKEDVFDWEVVGVVSEYQHRLVLCTVSLSGDESCFS